MDCEFSMCIDTARNKLFIFLGIERDDRRDHDRDRDDFRGRPRDRRRTREHDVPKKGNTVYVCAESMSDDTWRRDFTEERLRDAFIKLGNIVNVTMEENKR